MMKTVVLLLFVAYTAQGEMQTSETQNSRVVSAQKSANSIPVAQKPDTYYQPVQYQQQPQPQQQPQYYPVQYTQSPLYQQQPQAAMILIAQPSSAPQQTILSNAAHQLLNYFNANPQARYQLLQGYQPQPTQIQPYIAQPATGTSAYAYQISPVQPQQYQQQQYQQYQQPEYQFQQSSPLQNHQPISVAAQPAPVYAQSAPQSSQPQNQAPTKPTFAQGSQFQFPSQFGFAPTTQLSHISTLAQLTAQRYLPRFRGSVSPIITGLENFTPEQQAQIKAQINSGGPITPLQSNAVSPAGAAHQSAPSTQSISAPQQAANSQEFLPSQEDSTNQSQASNSASAYRNQFTKG